MMGNEPLIALICFGMVECLRTFIVWNQPSRENYEHLPSNALVS